MLVLSRALRAAVSVVCSFFECVVTRVLAHCAPARLSLATHTVASTWLAEEEEEEEEQV